MKNREILLQQIAQFLPYHLRGTCVWRDGNSDKPIRLYSEIDTYNVMNYVKGDTVYKPAMWPLDYFTEYCYSGTHHMLLSDIKSGDLPVRIWNALLSRHFDVYGWIEKGLAIDITTIEN